MPDTNPNYNEFYSPRLVAIYNTICALGDEKQFYIRLAKELSVETIIDLGCGTGLLTIELAKLGYQMIGVEPSKLMLEVACKNSKGLEIEWIQGDASSLREFNADLAIMTGHVAQFHIKDEQWQNALKSIYKALKPGGYLAFESRNSDVQPWNKEDQTGNTDWYAPNFHKTFHDPAEGEIEYRTKLPEVRGELVMGEAHYLFIKTGEELTSRNTLIFRTKEEITKSLENAGFIIENIYGNWDWSLVNSESPEMIFVAKKKELKEIMDRPINTLFMIESLDGKISTGDNDQMDVDKDFKTIKGVMEGLPQYYDLEKRTDLVSLNSGKVMAKIGVNTKTEEPNKMAVSFIIIDNKPHLDEKGVEYLAKWVKTLYLVTTNKEHPAFKVKENYPNIEIIHYENEVDLVDLMDKMKQKYGVERITIQSGGTLNAEWVRKGLIDHVSIVIAPCLIGGKDTQSLIGGESLHTEADLINIKALKMTKCEQLKDNYILVEYDVINKTELSE